MEYEAVKDNETSVEQVRDALEAAVHRQLMSDVPYGVLLSGGLDSSVTSAIAKNMLKSVLKVMILLKLGGPNYIRSR